MRHKVILLAGASGGLGSVTARLLSDEGAKVIAGYHRRKPEGIAESVQADITKAEDRCRLLDAAPGLYGLVVFTGISARAAADWNESLAVNYTGPIQLARDAAERMKQQGTTGSIVLIATMQTVGLFPGSTIYAGAKAALVHAARILASVITPKPASHDHFKTGQP